MSNIRVTRCWSQYPTVVTTISVFRRFLDQPGAGPRREAAGGPEAAGEGAAPAVRRRGHLPPRGRAETAGRDCQGKTELLALQLHA